MHRLLKLQLPWYWINFRVHWFVIVEIRWHFHACCQNSTERVYDFDLFLTFSSIFVFLCFLLINQQVWMKLLFNRMWVFCCGMLILIWNNCCHGRKRRWLFLLCRSFIVYHFIFNPDRLFDPNVFRILRETALLKKDNMAEVAARLRAAGQVIRLMATLKGTCCQDLRSQSSIHQDPEWRPDSSFSLRERS